MTNTVYYHLAYEISKNKLTEVESRMVVSRGIEVGEMEILFEGYKLSVWTSNVQYGDYSLKHGIIYFKFADLILRNVSI